MVEKDLGHGFVVLDLVRLYRNARSHLGAHKKQGHRPRDGPTRLRLAPAVFAALDLNIG